MNHKSRPIRVLSTIDQYWPFVGGAENIALRVVRLTNGPQVVNNVLTVASDRIVELSGGRFIRYEKTDDNYKIYRFRPVSIYGKRRNGPYTRYINLLRYIVNLVTLRREYDIIHAHTYYWPAIAGVIAGKLLRKKVIVTGHNTLVRLENEVSNGVYPCFMVPLLRSCDIYVAISNGIFNECRGILGIYPKKIRLIPNDIDDGQFSPIDEAGKKDLCEKLGLPFSGPIIICHGRLEKHKNVQLLIRAIAKVKECGIKLKCIVAGNGSYKRELLELSSSLDLEDFVQFIPFSVNVEEYVKCSDIFCIPSRYEGHPLALLEGMACGLVCLASNIDGNIDIVEDGSNGYLFEPDSVEGLSELIVRVLNLESDTIIRKAARRTIESRFSAGAMADSYRKLYVELMNGGGR